MCTLTHTAVVISVGPPRTFSNACTAQGPASETRDTFGSKLESRRLADARHVDFIAPQKNSVDQRDGVDSSRLSCRITCTKRFLQMRVRIQNFISVFEKRTSSYFTYSRNSLQVIFDSSVLREKAKERFLLFGRNINLLWSTLSFYLLKCDCRRDF